MNGTRGWRVARPPVPRWVSRLGTSGVPEAATAAALLIYSEVFPAVNIQRGWAATSITLILCLSAGMVARWPLLGTAGVGVGLALAASPWVSFSSFTLFALFIPIVSNGAHGRNYLRDFAAVGYCALACLITIPKSNGPDEVAQTIAIWTLFSALAWSAGRTVHRLRAESEHQAELRTESLRSQRRSIARDLHDTVSYATTTMIMRAEQIKLRSTDPALVEDLDFIISTGRRSVRDLRGMMEALRRNDPDLDPGDEAPWRLVTVDDVITERVAELAAHGITLQVSVEDDLEALPGSVRETLGKLIVEATSNMVKHAAPGPCRLIIDLHDDTVEAVFTNPLFADAEASGSEGLGIIGAAERVEALGGELEATRASGTWILRVQLPFGE